MTSGIHHLTFITRKVQPNVDFYVGFLGLRLVKQTGGFEDGEQLHLFYGDCSGTPGSLVTFLVWEDGGRGRVSHGQVSEVAFAINPSSIGFWLERALRYQIQMEGPLQEMGETVLRLKDPDGIIVKLVASKLSANDLWVGDGITAEAAIKRVHSATILTEKAHETQSFIEQYFGFSPLKRQGTIQRLVSQSGDMVDIRDAAGFWPAIAGTGTADHIAFRAADRAEVEQTYHKLTHENASEMNMHDRKYFYSLYVREPAGTLIELASDGPGFLVDEELEILGTKLMLPPHSQEAADDLKVKLPQFSLPDMDRIRYSDLPFIYRIYQPEETDGSYVILLHGTGGNETDLMPFGHKIAPKATLIGVRGRSIEGGSPRWFRQLSINQFDQKDIAFESEAFAAFVEGIVRAHDVDLSRATFLGYSNGANFLGAFLRLQPHIIQKAVLLRAIEVLQISEDSERVSEQLSDANILMLTGKDDFFSGLGEPLRQALLDSGAKLENKSINAGHNLIDEDITLVRQWLEGF